MYRENFFATDEKLFQSLELNCILMKYSPSTHNSNPVKKILYSPKIQMINSHTISPIEKTRKKMISIKAIN